MNEFLRRLAGAAVSAALIALPAAAQSADSVPSTKSGIFTADQATKGRDVHGAACLSCHKPVEHTGKFWSEKVGSSLGELFGYLRSSMPQDNPGSLADDDYASVIAYILQLNAMPPGQKPLPGDSAALSKIKIAAGEPKASNRTGRKQ